MSACPTMFSFPGMQTQWLVPFRKIDNAPSCANSATVASRLTTAGPESLARRIFSSKISLGAPLFSSIGIAFDVCRLFADVKPFFDSAPAAEEAVPNVAAPTKEIPWTKPRRERRSVVTTASLLPLPSANLFEASVPPIVRGGTHSSNETEDRERRPY
jgi:hypothetical protein